MRKCSKDPILIQPFADSWMNINNKKSTINDYMESLISFCVTSPLIGLIMFKISKNQNAVKASVITVFVITLLMTFIRIIFKQNWLYALMHIMVFVLLVIIYEPLLQRILVCLYAFFYMIYSMQKGRRKVIRFYNLNFLYLGELILLVLYGISYYSHIRILNYYIICCSIVFVSAALIYFHVTKTKKLMEWENQLSKDALLHIRIASRKIIEAIMILSITASIVLYLTGLFNTGLLPIDISWNFKGKNLAKPVKPQISNMQNMQNIDLSKLGGKSADSKIIQYIMNFIEILLLAFTVFLIVMILVKAVRSIYKHFMIYIRGKDINKNYEVESVLNINDIISDTGNRLNRFAKMINFNFNLSNREKIRRIYYKTVIKNKKKNSIIETYFSPENIKNIVYNDTKKNIDAATKIYEKARYGKEECTRKDVEDMKSQEI